MSKTVTANDVVFTHERSLNAWDFYYNGALYLMQDTTDGTWQAGCGEVSTKARRSSPEEALVDLEDRANKWAQALDELDRIDGAQV